MQRRLTGWRQAFFVVGHERFVMLSHSSYDWGAFPLPFQLPGEFDA
ncbi:hypothetical protein [Halostagnicola sp. A-GB9-2]|nr:hypothetical protein [Halostagnicola sp. A-GB9-2]MDJ1431465.1 hypothetical protein [Halostagnicola sp. A-GB9-2]